MDVIDACKKTDDFNPDISEICSEYFVVKDYLRDFKTALLGYAPNQNILKDDAVPRKNLPASLKRQIIPVTELKHRGSVNIANGK